LKHLKRAICPLMRWRAGRCPVRRHRESLTGGIDRQRVATLVLRGHLRERLFGLPNASGRGAVGREPTNRAPAGLPNEH
jgi:hypothetical protein